jgi:hypothetical protein
MDEINNSRSIKSGQNVLSQARVLDRYDVTYNVDVLGLGLASQRGGRLTNQPMKMLETSMATKR